MLMRRADKFRIRPTDDQEHLFVSMAGCRRFVWNHFLSRRREHYKLTKKTLSVSAMCKELTVLKRQQDTLFLNECDSQALQQTLIDLDRAFTNFFEKRARFPKYKSRKKTPHSFRIPQRVVVRDESHLYIPKAGPVETIFHRELAGSPKSATVKQEPSGKWQVTIVSEFDGPEPKTGLPVSPIGIDAGLETFITTSDGVKVKPPKFYRKQEQKLKRVQRHHSRKKAGSQNKAKSKRKVAQTHARVRDQRADFLHKQSRSLCDQHDLICIEDLNLSALAKTKLRGHSKSWSDVAWGSFKHQLNYKQMWLGHRLVKVDRFFPSSQLCSACGFIEKHDLSVRSWVCPNCKTKHDRDENAATNILNEGKTVAIGNVETLNVCGANVRPANRGLFAPKQKTSGCEVRSPQALAVGVSPLMC